jgi:transposase-like protein
MKTVHLHKKYFCDVCNANFSETMSLKLHKIKIHNLEPKFKCQECNTGFVYQSQLKLHEKGHLTGKQFRVREKNEIVDRGKRAWECTTCLKTFSMKANYKRYEISIKLIQFIAFF